MKHTLVVALLGLLASSRAWAQTTRAKKQYDGAGELASRESERRAPDRRCYSVFTEVLRLGKSRRYASRDLRDPWCSSSALSLPLRWVLRPPCYHHRNHAV